MSRAMTSQMHTASHVTTTTTKTQNRVPSKHGPRAAVLWSDPPPALAGSYKPSIWFHLHITYRVLSLFDK